MLASASRRVLRCHAALLIAALLALVLCPETHAQAALQPANTQAATPPPNSQTPTAQTAASPANATSQTVAAGTTAAAQPPGTSNSQPPGTSNPPPSGTGNPQPPATSNPPTCDDLPPVVLPAGNLKLVVAVDPTTVWQPRGSDVKFTVSGTGFSPDSAAIIACVRWKADPQAKWYKSPALRLIDNGTAAGTYGFTVTVPPDLPEASSSWIQRWDGAKVNGNFTGLDIVPIADFRVMARSMAASPPPWSPLDVTLPVGITSSSFAFLVTLLLVGLACMSLYAFGVIRKVPGGRDVILRIISTKAGYASLSQLQIILWSFVIGAGAVYVMSLSGNLIEITQGTLILLGISGAATLAAKLQSHTETQSTTPARQPAPPGKVTGLALNGPIGETDARLSWAAPTSGGTLDTYTVEYRPYVANANPDDGWVAATTTLTRPGFRVVGLAANTSYDFRVRGVNAAGPGVPDTVDNKRTTAGPPARPAAVTDLHPTNIVTNSVIELAWLPVANAPTCGVQYRVHDSDDDWTDATDKSDHGATIKGLKANTTYDLRVAAITAAAAQGQQPVTGVWNTIQVRTIGPRLPQWSDLVVVSDGQNEIDVTRVQMLFFTVIVALFVALRVLASGEIPAIPEGYLLLMGISNGVYVTAKFIPG